MLSTCSNPVGIRSYETIESVHQEIGSFSSSSSVIPATRNIMDCKEESGQENNFYSFTCTRGIWLCFLAIRATSGIAAFGVNDPHSPARRGKGREI